jgi:CspA family cold shock protein
VSKGTVRMFKADRRFGFIRPDDGGDDVFFHETSLKEGDQIVEGTAVTYEMGIDAKSGRSKAVRVDLV